MNSCYLQRIPLKKTLESEVKELFSEYTIRNILNNKLTIQWF